MGDFLIKESKKKEVVMMFKRLAYLVLAVLFVFPTLSNAGDRLEKWRTKGLVFAERNDDGEFVRWGKLTLESWNDETQQSSWVARHDDGTFVSGYRGRLEKWEVKGGKQVERLVVRNAEEQWVTWVPMENNVTEGWENWDFGDDDSRSGWYYVVRLHVDGTPPLILDNVRVSTERSLETWKGWRWKVLVVRDTSDGQQNGQILTWLPGQYDRRANGEKWIEYRTPKGQWITSYKLNKKESDAKDEEDNLEEETPEVQEGK